MTKHTYVFAKNYDHFRVWCRQHEVSHNDHTIHFVSRPSQLWGLTEDHARFAFYETWREHPGAGEFARYVQKIQAIGPIIKEAKMEPVNGLFTKTFWKRTAERVLSTFAQAVLGVLTGGVFIHVDWKVQAITVGATTLASLLKNIVGSQLGGNSADPSWVDTTKEDKNVDKKAEAASN